MLPSSTDPREKRVFASWSVLCLLMGKNFYQSAPVGLLEIVSPAKWQIYCHEVWRRKQDVLDRIADHRTLVDSLVKSAVHGKSLETVEDAKVAPKLGPDVLSIDPQPVMAQMS